MIARGSIRTGQPAFNAITTAATTPSIAPTSPPSRGFDRLDQVPTLARELGARRLDAGPHRAVQWVEVARRAGAPPVRRRAGSAARDDAARAFERRWIRICYLRFMFARRVLHALSARALYLAALAVLTAFDFERVRFDALRVARMLSASRYKQLLNTATAPSAPPQPSAVATCKASTRLPQ
jgi:hypothetical protein